MGVQDWQPQGPEGEGNTSKTICFTRVWVSRVGNPRGQRVGKEIKNHWLYKDLGVQGWQPQVPKGEGNISTTIGFIRVWVSRVCSPRCQRAAETHQNHWFYKGLGVRDWQPQGPKGEGNTSKTVGFIKVWVSKVGSPRGHKVRKHIKPHWFYKGLGAQSWQAQKATR